MVLPSVVIKHGMDARRFARYFSRGATRSGQKVREVEPRADPALCFGIGERPRRIAAGVLATFRRKNNARLSVE